MLKNILNKIKSYYEIGVVRNGELIAEYNTALPIIKNGIAHNKIVEYLEDMHGKGIILVLNKKDGKMPKDHPIIDINIPKRQKLKYNR